MKKSFGPKKSSAAQQKSSKIIKQYMSPHFAGLNTSYQNDTATSPTDVAVGSSTGRLNRSVLEGKQSSKKHLNSVVVPDAQKKSKLTRNPTFATG